MSQKLNTTGLSLSSLFVYKAYYIYRVYHKFLLKTDKLR